MQNKNNKISHFLSFWYILYIAGTVYLFAERWEYCMNAAALVRQKHRQHCYFARFLANGQCEKKKISRRNE